MKELCTLFSPYFLIFSSGDINQELQKEHQRSTKKAIKQYSNPKTIIGNSAAIEQVREAIKTAAGKDWPVYILGETGTGKELVARAIHFQSKRANGPWVPVNCAAIKKELIEADLFGHKKGAFTGAEFRKGYIQSAKGGTLFLDEIGELPYEVQGKLLRAVEYNEVHMLGSDELIENIDFRLITATNRNLYQMVTDGQFRLDLFERICVKKIYVPPLRDRKDDIPILAEHYASPKNLSAEAIEYLKGLPFLGNVRRLRNLIEMACDCNVGKVIQKEDIAIQVRQLEEEQQTGLSSAALVPELSKTPPSALHLDFFKFKSKYQQALNEFRAQSRRTNGSNESATELSAESKRLLQELEMTLKQFYSQAGRNWWFVGRQFFGLESKRELRAMGNWIYQIEQVYGAVKVTSALQGTQANSSEES